MKNIIRIILLIVILTVFFTCTTQPGDAEKSGDTEMPEEIAGPYEEYDIPIPRNWDKYTVRENFTTQDLVNEMGIGINLGNTLEACGDWITGNHINNYIRAWGSPLPTKEMIEGYAKAGFKSLRIPIAWSNLMNMNGYVINPDLLNIVEDVVNWTIDCGMVAMINLHWDNGWWHEYYKPEKKDEVLARYTAIWTQVCARFEKYGDPLIFENMNEVGFDDVWNQWGGTQAQKKQAFDLKNELNQIFIDLVRASGGNNAKRHLLIDVYNTGLEYSYDPLFKWPSDPASRYALSVHYYTPALFIFIDPGVESGWYPGQVGLADWGSAADWNELNTSMDNLKANVVDKGIPVIIGEYAVCSKRPRDQIRLWTTAVTEAVYSRGMCPMLWDTPGGEYNRNTFRFNDSTLIKEFREIADSR